MIPLNTASIRGVFFECAGQIRPPGKEKTNGRKLDRIPHFIAANGWIQSINSHPIYKNRHPVIYCPKSIMEKGGTSVYRRYSDVNPGTVPVSQIRRNRMKNILILLLIAALAAVLIISIPALQNRSGTRTLYIQRMQTEISDAIHQTATLSRSAGADSAAILARIRCNLHSIRLLNQLSIAQEGPSGTLLVQESLDSLISDVDHYLSYLTTGMDTGEYQTNLQNGMNTLQSTIGALQ